MNRRKRLLICSLSATFVAIIAIFVCRRILEMREQARESIAFDKLLEEFGNEEGYRCSRAITTAAFARKMGRDRATDRLREFAKRKQSDDHHRTVIILCRMLFDPPMQSEFRRPDIGGATFFGGTSYADWPLEPIEIVDGVPFVVVWGYQGSGVEEFPEWYLNYCFEKCYWSEREYREKSHDELDLAFQSIVNSQKWKRELSEFERRFFAQQAAVKIRPVPN